MIRAFAKKCIEYGIRNTNYQLVAKSDHLNSSSRTSALSNDPTEMYFQKQAYLEETEFQYILWLDRIYQKILTVPGSIVELGVAYGRNPIIFARLAELYGDKVIRKYVGFDTFSGYTHDTLKTNQHLNGKSWTFNSRKLVEERLVKAKARQFVELVEGDIVTTTKEYAEKNLNLQIALLYVDCNAYEPSYVGIKNLFSRVNPGGVICVDEKQPRSETRALFDFARENNFIVVKDPGPFSVPAYIVKK